MKADIHPKYGEASVTCSCGNTFTTESTKSNDEFLAEIARGPASTS